MSASKEQIEETIERLSFSSDLATAVAYADLLIESIPEDPSIKIDFYKKLTDVAPQKTIFTTNSSTKLPSQFAELHFPKEIWEHNTAEIMGHPGTVAGVFDIQSL